MRLLLAILAAVLLPVPVAQAAPVYCHLVRDPVPDATAFLDGVDSPRNDDGMDVKELDLSTTGRELTAVIRMYALNPTDVMAPTGRLFSYGFTVKKKAYSIRMLLDWSGAASSDVGPKPVVDSTSGVYELRVTVPLSAFPGIGKLTGRDRFTRLEASSRRWYGDLATGQQIGRTVDTASGTTAYPHLGRSCVVTGA